VLFGAIRQELPLDPELPPELVIFSTANLPAKSTASCATQFKAALRKKYREISIIVKTNMKKMGIVSDASIKEAASSFGFLR
jgi:hypothetical protein